MMTLKLLLVLALIAAAVGTQVSANINGRIAGGEDSAVGSHPYTVSVQDATNSWHLCTGVIYNERTILTVASALTLSGSIEAYPARNFCVRAGSVQRLIGGQVVCAKTVAIHPDYSPTIGVNNLAVLILEKSLTYNDKTQAIAVATQMPSSGVTVTVSGWGATELYGNIVQRLRTTTMQVLSSDECEEELYLPTDGLLCLKQSSTVSQGLCTGDGGSPAVTTDSQQLVGIGSFFVGGCGGIKPDGFIHITHFIDWIEENAYA